MRTTTITTVLSLLVLLSPLPLYSGQPPATADLPSSEASLEGEAPAGELRKIYLVYNPKSGKKGAEKIALQVQNQLTSAGIEATLLATTHPNHATELARSLPLAGYNAFCVIGGDGTLNEAINGLLSRASDDQLPPLCIIPGGTGNSFSRDLGFDSPEAATAALIGERTRMVDVGLLTFHNDRNEEEQRYMVNMVGLGLGVDANRKAEGMRFLGPARYNAGIMWEILKKRHHEATVTIDGVPTEGDFSIILIQNTKRGGNGLLLAPNAEIDDGQLDILLAPRLSQLKMLGLFSKISKNGSHINAPEVTYKKFTALTIESPTPMALNIDGENYGSTPLSIKTLAKKVRVFY